MANRPVYGAAAKLRDVSLRIEALSEVRSQQELVSEIQQILRRMMFYVSQSEAVIHEYHENWHDDYTEALLTASAKSSSKGGGGAAVRSACGSLGGTQGAGGEGWRGGVGEEGGWKGGAGEGWRGAPRRPPPAARRLGHHSSTVPLSLRTILAGTHPSLQEAPPHQSYY
jgi:hypothetical protein